MSNNSSSEIVPGEPMAYEIGIRDQLGRQSTDWFGGFAITLDPNGDTLLTGRVVDQAALYGLLRTLRDLGIPLVSVSPVWAIGGLFLCSLLFRTRLIPRFLAAGGLIGYVSLMVGMIAEIFGIHISLMLSVPGIFFEVGLPVWLFIKGFQPEVYSSRSSHA